MLKMRAKGSPSCLHLDAGRESPAGPGPWPGDSEPEAAPHPLGGLYAAAVVRGCPGEGRAAP